jgi:hypothetical protein
MIDDVEEVLLRAYGMLKIYMEGTTKTHQEVVTKATELLSLFDMSNQECIDYVVDKYEENHNIKAYEPDVLVDSNNLPETWLYNRKENTPLDHFNRYKEYLRNDDFPEDAIEKMEKSTEKILSYCADPENRSRSLNTKKKGLVIGDVQSGKTANYLALINMAADYGYKLVILLSGLTDSLRIQTQKRIDGGFVGAKSDSIGSDFELYMGVGTSEERHYAIPMTNQQLDFVKFKRANSNFSRSDFAKPVIMVVKKNKGILTQMKEWVKPDNDDIKCNNILIIDDESDNASVNTKNKDEDPSVINRLIRDIFNNFPIATYVGYTATPFANIFIDPYDDESSKDLFPSDFIVQLKEPDNYFGLHKALMNGEHVRILDEQEENFLPVKHNKDVEVYPELPESLIEAINDFILINVIRTLRGQKYKHRTFMINVSRLNNIQDKIKDKVEEYVKKIRSCIEQSYKLSIDEFRKDPKLNKIYNQYLKDNFYKKVRENYSWDQIQGGLNFEVQQFELTIMNNRNSKNRFNYDDYKDKGARLIAIGGFVLSRGLTLEGLTISYFSRNANAYDTMLQMCRWFGYRSGYEDLCRIYISQINIDNYAAIEDAVNDLKDQISIMSSRGKTPMDFGLMVKESPETLETSMLITSRNKMRATEEVYRSFNFSGADVDTSKIYRDVDTNFKNRLAIDELVIDLKQNGILLENYNNSGRYMFKDVDKNIISNFISKLLIPIENRKFDQESLSDFIANSEEFTKWDIVVATGTHAGDTWNFCSTDLYLPSRSFEAREEENIVRISGGKNRLVDPGLYNSGLSEKEKEDAKRIAMNSDKPHLEPVAKDYLQVRKTPLLIIYPVKLNPKHDNELQKSIASEFDKDKIMFGFAIGFPGIDNRVMVKYRANERKRRELAGLVEEEEEEEVYGEE